MKRSTWGIILLAFPLPLLIATMSAYAISSFIFSQIVQTGVSDPWVGTGQIIHVILQALGLIAILGFFVGMPVGAYLLFTGSKSKK